MIVCREAFVERYLEMVEKKCGRKLLRSEVKTFREDAMRIFDSIPEFAKIVDAGKWEESQKKTKELMDMNWKLIAENTGSHKKWEALQKHLANFPKCPIKYGEAWESQSQETDYLFKIFKWFEELGRMVNSKC